MTTFKDNPRINVFSVKTTPKNVNKPCNPNNNLLSTTNKWLLASLIAQTKKKTSSRNSRSELIKCAIISSWLATRAAVSHSIQFCCLVVSTSARYTHTHTMACNGFHHHDDDDHDNFHHYSDLEGEHDEQKDKYAKCHKKNCIVQSVRYFTEFFGVKCISLVFVVWRYSDGSVRLRNPHIDLMDQDILYHLALGSGSHDLVEMFGDVKVSFIQTFAV